MKAPAWVGTTPRPNYAHGELYDGAGVRMAVIQDHGRGLIYAYAEDKNTKCWTASGRLSSRKEAKDWAEQLTGIVPEKPNP